MSAYTYQYQQLTTVMASPTTGQVVPAAYGDQLRANLQSTVTGMWFKATGAVSQALVTTSWNRVQMSTFDTVDFTAATVSPYVNLSSGYITVSLAGMWMFGGYSVCNTTIQNCELSIGTTTGQFFESGRLATSMPQEHASTIAEITTTPAYLSWWLYSTSNTNLSASIAPQLWGIWLGEL